MKRALEVFDYANENGLVTESLFSTWIDLAHKNIKAPEDVSVCAHIANVAVSAFPTSAPLWAKRIKLAVSHLKDWKIPMTLKTWNSLKDTVISAVQKLGTEATPIVGPFIEFLCEMENYDLLEFMCLYVYKENISNVNDALSKAVDALYKDGGLGRIRKLCDQMLGWPGKPNAVASLKVFLKLEKMHMPASYGQMKRIFELLVETFPHDEGTKHGHLGAD